jgi:predicted 3-demethylubiquinone-9 3-methyltransferase (glyoxalase superfamily)
MKIQGTQKITPFLWFDDQAEEAAKFYVSLFKNSRITSVTRYGAEGKEITGKPKGSVMTVAFRLAGQEFTALNGGPLFKFTEAFSLVVSCTTQAEIDKYWERLSQGGKKSQCGWLKDRYGLSWQIVPAGMGELFAGKDPARSERVMAAMLKMRKLNLKALQRAYDGRSSPRKLP